MATMSAETLEKMANEIKRLPGVQSVDIWARVPGRERLYVELTKHNGGADFHGGCGRKVYIQASDGLFKLDDFLGDWAGAATRNHHDNLGTIDAIKAIRDAHRDA